MESSETDNSKASTMEAAIRGFVLRSERSRLNKYMRSTMFLHDLEWQSREMLEMYHQL